MVTGCNRHFGQLQIHVLPPGGRLSISDLSLPVGKTIFLPSVALIALYTMDLLSNY